MSNANPTAPSSSNVVAPSGDALSTTGTPQPPWSTPLISGALVRISRSSVLDKTFVLFQYNPETLTRSLTPSYYEKRKDMMKGPAGQTISLTIQLEASDKAWNSITGVLPPLSGLEMMTNPSVVDLLKYKLDLLSGKMAAVPPAAPRILFIWGPGRILPVTIKSLTIKEKMFNSLLTPMVAEAELSLEVFPFKDADDVDVALLMVNLATVQTLSILNTVEEIVRLAGVALAAL